jgi:hypothetical protein
MTLSVRSDTNGGAILMEGGVEVLRVGANGNVTTPAGVVKTSSTKKTICAAHLAATTQPIALNTYTKIIFDTATLNPGTGYNVANGRFTPDVAGWYEVTATVSVEGTQNTDNFQINVYKNGASARRLAVLSTSVTTNLATLHLSGSGLVYLNGSTDYVEIFTYRGQVSGTAAVSGAAAGNLSHFSAKLVYPD